MKAWALRVALVAFAAALVAACFPPLSLGPVVAWFALVPLIFAVRNLRAWSAAALGLLFGTLVAFLVFGWMFHFESFHLVHGVALATYFGAYLAFVGVAMALTAWEPRGLVLVPATNALAEWLRGHAGFLAVSWGTMGETQHENLPVLQIASFGGEPLVGIVVVAANVAIAQLVYARDWRTRALPLTTVAAVALVHAIGAARLAAPIEGRTIVASAVQPAILPNERDGAHRAEHFARLSELTARAGTLGAELVVWPETAVTSIDSDIESKLMVRDVVEALGAPIVFGSSEVEKLAQDAESIAAPKKRESFNAAFVMAPRTKVPDPYLKVRLLPFGEYRPIDLPEWLAPKLFDTKAGARRVTLEAGDIVVEPVICWENLFADDVRSTATDSPTVIAHLVNDAWFGPTAQPTMHNLVSTMRAVESGRPVVVASNTGPSQIVDAYGRVVARSPKFFAPDVVVASVQMPAGQTPYRRFGDWTWALPLLAIALALRTAENYFIARSAPAMGRA